MVSIVKAKDGIGIGFADAAELLSIMDFIQELATFGANEINEGTLGEFSNADSLEEFIGQVCLIQLKTMSDRIHENPDMLDELKIAASMGRNDSHRDRSYNDAMYG